MSGGGGVGASVNEFASVINGIEGRDGAAGKPSGRPDSALGTTVEN